MAEVRAVPMVVAMDREEAVAAMVEEDSRHCSRMMATVLSRRERGGVRKAAGYFETVVPNELEEL